MPTETVDQILEKYVQALGGAQVVQSAKTRVMTGTLTSREQVTSNITVQERSTGEYRIDIATQPIATIRATNGKAAWAVGGGRGGGPGGTPPDAARDLAGFQMQQGLRLADFALPLQLKDRYRTLLVNKAYDTIDGKQVVAITGNPYPNVTEQLSFDRESGLLLRRVDHDRFWWCRLWHHELAASRSTTATIATRAASRWRIRYVTRPGIR